MRAGSTEYEELARKKLKESRQADITFSFTKREDLITEALVYSNLAIAAATEESNRWGDR